MAPNSELSHPTAEQGKGEGGGWAKVEKVCGGKGRARTGAQGGFTGILDVPNPGREVGAAGQVGSGGTGRYQDPEIGFSHKLSQHFLSAQH